VMHDFQKFRHVVDVNWGNTSKTPIDLLEAPVTRSTGMQALRKFRDIMAPSSFMV